MNADLCWARAAGGVTSMLRCMLWCTITWWVQDGGLLEATDLIPLCDSKHLMGCRRIGDAIDSTGARLGPSFQGALCVLMPAGMHWRAYGTRPHGADTSKCHPWCSISTQHERVQRFTCGRESKGSAATMHGPLLQVKLELQNNGSRTVTGMAVTISYNSMLYRLKQCVFAIPVLVPGLTHRQTPLIQCRTGSALISLAFMEEYAKLRRRCSASCR
jgi:hypothetical protein